jgi:hypothetical protein
MLKCPKCGQDGLGFTVRATMVVLAEVESNYDCNDYKGGDMEWAKSAPMTCRGCLHSGPAKSFEIR